MLVSNGDGHLALGGAVSGAGGGGGVAAVAAVWPRPRFNFEPVAFRSTCQRTNFCFRHKNKDPIPSTESSSVLDSLGAHCHLLINQNSNTCVPSNGARRCKICIWPPASGWTWSCNLEPLAGLDCDCNNNNNENNNCNAKWPKTCEAQLQDKVTKYAKAHSMLSMANSSNSNNYNSNNKTSTSATATATANVTTTANAFLVFG
ncbi:hypothetical protein AWZ03_003654 [Drosophila navojoa]|uniref:Uncharacterized protein n=1 Tax=Drosophila navojoa TaxID=7232 RepID=A0A484BMB1_DRONA|nr:hypothetical protein AWZ03_003654 [Drosophila navojoa]